MLKRRPTPWSKPNKNFNEEKTKDGDTLKGNSQSKLKSKKDGTKSSLERAAISEKKTSTAKSLTAAKVVPPTKTAPAETVPSEKNEMTQVAPVKASFTPA